MTASGAGAAAPVIRLARVEDAASLAEFGARTFRDTFGPDNRPEDLAQYLASAFGLAIQHAELTNPSFETWLTLIDDRLAAYAQLHEGPVPPDVPGRAIELRRFYVDRRWQGRSLAQKLMDRTAEAARGRGANAMWLGVWERNLRGIAFYRRSGFVDVGSQVFVLGSDRQIDRIMWRKIKMTNDE